MLAVTVAVTGRHSNHTCVLCTASIVESALEETIGQIFRIGTVRYAEGL